MGKYLTWLFALPSVAATAVLLLKANGQLILTDEQLVIAILLTAFKPIADLVVGTVNEQRESKRRKRQDMIEVLLRAGLRGLINDHGLVWDKIGINAFVVQRHWHRFGNPRLVRVGQVKFSLAHPSGITWTRGKGVIGMCWATQIDKGRDLHSDYSRVADWTESLWNQEPDEFKQGLTFQEFNRTKQYGAIVATPIFDPSGRFVGCISVDAPAGCFEILWSEPARDRLRDVASTVAHQL